MNCLNTSLRNSSHFKHLVTGMTVDRMNCFNMSLWNGSHFKHLVTGMIVDSREPGVHVVNILCHYFPIPRQYVRHFVFRNYSSVRPQTLANFGYNLQLQLTSLLCLRSTSGYRESTVIPVTKCLKCEPF